jgi:hypothetical protein
MVSNRVQLHPLSNTAASLERPRSSSVGLTRLLTQSTPVLKELNVKIW